MKYEVYQAMCYDRGFFPLPQNTMLPIETNNGFYCEVFPTFKIYKEDVIGWNPQRVVHR